jgi:hypothetical protein
VLPPSQLKEGREVVRRVKAAGEAAAEGVVDANKVAGGRRRYTRRWRGGRRM